MKSKRKLKKRSRSKRKSKSKKRSKSNRKSKSKKRIKRSKSKQKSKSKKRIVYRSKAKNPSMSKNGFDPFDHEPTCIFRLSSKAGKSISKKKSKSGRSKRKRLSNRALKTISVYYEGLPTYTVKIVNGGRVLLREKYNTSRRHDYKYKDILITKKDGKTVGVLIDLGANKYISVGGPNVFQFKSKEKIQQLKAVKSRSRGVVFYGVTKSYIYLLTLRGHILKKSDFKGYSNPYDYFDEFKTKEKKPSMYKVLYSA